jgi:hypothetical protein
MKKFCSNCREWKESWDDHPNHRSHLTYRRSERCWKCDEWTLSDRTIFVPRSSAVNRSKIEQGLNAVRIGQTSRFTCGGIKHTSNNGETVHERLIYDGGGTYTRIIEKDGRQITEIKELQTFMEVFFLEIADIVVENPQVLLLCTVS